MPERLRIGTRDEGAGSPAPFVFLPALREIAQQKKKQGQAGMRLSKIGAQLQSPAIGGLGLLELAELQEGVPQVAVRLGIAGIAGNGSPVSRGAFFQLPLFHERITEVAMPLGIV